MSKRLVFAVSLLALTTACTEEVGLLDESRNFGGRGGNSLEPVMDILDRTPPPANPHCGDAQASSAAMASSDACMPARISTDSSRAASLGSGSNTRPQAI